jgi:flagellar protein FlaF
MAQQAYAPTQVATKTARGTEQELFARVTYKLRRAAQIKDTNFPALAQALHENRQVWTHLAGEVADQSNALPNDLRARIFYLAEFTAHQTRKVLRGEGSVDVLVEITAAIMRGLRETGAAA